MVRRRSTALLDREGRSYGGTTSTYDSYVPYAGAGWSSSDPRRVPCAGHSVVVLYRAPHTISLYAMRVSGEHVATLQDRIARGAFCPRTLFAARPDAWQFIPRHLEPIGAPGNVHEWEIR